MMAWKPEQYIRADSSRISKVEPPERVLTFILEVFLLKEDNYGKK